MSRRKRRTLTKKAGENKKGPKRTFSDQDLQDVTDLCGKAGARNKDLAECFNLSEKTIEYWIRHYKDFRKAVHSGRIQCVKKVANALFTKAIGYYVPSEKIFLNTIKEYDENGNIIKEYREPLRVPYMEYHAIDANAAYRFLSIQHREVWAEVQNWNVNHNHSGEVSHKHLDEISTEGLSERAKNLVFEVTKKQIEEGKNSN